MTYNRPDTMRHFSKGFGYKIDYANEIAEGEKRLAVLLSEPTRILSESYDDILAMSHGSLDATWYIFSKETGTALRAARLGITKEELGAYVADFEPESFLAFDVPQPPTERFREHLDSANKKLLGLQVYSPKDLARTIRNTRATLAKNRRMLLGKKGALAMARRQVIWECAAKLHAGVRGPSKPRRDATCRYCLGCSLLSTRLVPRVSPTLAKERSLREESRAKKSAARSKAEKEKSAAYYTVHGVDLREELRLLLATDVAKPLRANPPKLVVRNCQKGARRLGFANYDTWSLSVNRTPGGDATMVRETLAHELAHFLSVRDRGHGVAWKTAFRVLSEQAYGVRPIVENRFLGPLAAKLREIESASP